jgi:hypothetical protein
MLTIFFPFRIGLGYLTTTVPIMPDSRCVGIRHEYSKVPAFENFQRISPDSFRRESQAVRFVVLHVRVFLHRFPVLQIFRGCRQQELMGFRADIAQHETDLLAALHLDDRRRIVHFVQGDDDFPCRLSWIAGLAC